MDGECLGNYTAPKWSTSPRAHLNALGPNCRPKFSGPYWGPHKIVSSMLQGDWTNSVELVIPKEKKKKKFSRALDLSRQKQSARSMVTQRRKWGCLWCCSVNSAPWRLRCWFYPCAWAIYTVLQPLPRPLLRPRPLCTQITGQFLCAPLASGKENLHQCFSSSFIFIGLFGSAVDPRSFCSPSPNLRKLSWYAKGEEFGIWESGFDAL